MHVISHNEMYSIVSVSNWMFQFSLPHHFHGLEVQYEYFVIRYMYISYWYL